MVVPIPALPAEGKTLAMGIRLSHYRSGVMQSPRVTGNYPGAEALSVQAALLFVNPSKHGEKFQRPTGPAPRAAGVPQATPSAVNELREPLRFCGWPP